LCSQEDDEKSSEEEEERRLTKLKSHGPLLATSTSVKRSLKNSGEVHRHHREEIWIFDRRTCYISKTTEGPTREATAKLSILIDGQLSSHYWRRCCIDARSLTTSWSIATPSSIKLKVIASICGISYRFETTIRLCTKLKRTTRTSARCQGCLQASNRNCFRSETGSVLNLNRCVIPFWFFSGSLFRQVKPKLIKSWHMWLR